MKSNDPAIQPQHLNLTNENTFIVNAGSDFRTVITAHEYSHILNGDCSPNQTDPATREKAADEKAEQLLLTCFLGQYRLKEQAVKPPASVGGNIEAFLAWFVNLPQEQQLDYAQDACVFRVKIEKDRLILKEAIRFAKEYFRDVAP